MTTVGLLITDLTRTWTIQQWSGVLEAAHERGVNLITFDGSHLCSPYGFEAQANALYELARSERINGLVIWTEGLVAYSTPEEVGKFFQRYAPVPCVSVEHAVEGVPSVVNDDFRAMRSMIEHLIEVHGCKRIGYIKHATPLHHAFDERYRAYRETLAEHGIPFDPALVSPPVEAEAPPAPLFLSDWMRKGHAAEWDAIVAHNDLIALRVQEDLRSLSAPGSPVPAVTGFDDSEEGALSSPPLTTVRPPFREMGRAAVEALLDLIEGKRVQSARTLQGGLVIRRSCGCADPAVSGPAATSKRHGAPRELSTPEDLRGYVAAVIDVGRGSRRQLLDDFVAGIRGDETGAFVRHLEAIAEESEELPALAEWLTELRGVTVPLLEGEMLRQAEELFHRAGAVLQKAAGRQQRRFVLESLHREAALRDVQGSLFTKLSVGSLMDELASSLPKIGIHGFALSLYEDPLPYAYPDEAPQFSRMVLGMKAGRRFNLPPGGLRYATRAVVPQQMLPSTEPFNLVAEALYFQDRQLGFALFEVGPQDGVIYASLRKVVSNNLQGARLVEEEHVRTRQLQENDRERRQLESMLHQAQKLEAVGQLAGGVAHEFNNILTAIMGYGSMLMMNMTKHDLRRDLVERILSASRRAADLAQQMLILGQKDGGNLSVIDLNDTIKSACRSLAGQLGQKIELKFEPWRETVPVLADTMRIEQILVNLTANARDAMPQGGAVVIRISAEKIEPPAQALDRKPGTYAHLAFSDTGIGMDEMTRTRLFEPFFTTKDIGKGTGLGLATVWAIVEQHHGFITVKSQVDRGTTVDIFLPLHRREDRTEKEGLTLLHGTETILVADDNQAVRDQTRSVLERHGYSVIEAADGEAAATRFGERAAEIHLVLLSTTIAKRDGWEVAHEIRSRAPAARIVFTGEYAPSRFGKEPLRVDDPRFLAKPFTADQLLDKVRKALDEANETDEAPS